MTDNTQERVLDPVAETMLSELAQLPSDKSAAPDDIARAFAVDRPLLLLDEPTAALDAENSAAVIQLIKKKKSQGCALVGIFHDQGIISQTCSRILTF